MIYIVTLEIEILAGRTIEYELEVRADGVAEAVLTALQMAWEEHGEEASISIRRIA